ncbi:meiosis-specific protein MEI4-like [Arapaima gigas]
MEESSCSVERNDAENDFYLRVAKLAVAVAVIKSKPAGMTGKQHAEYLASRLLAEDDTWKAKAQSLQEEVLQLQQELLLSKDQLDPHGSSRPEVGNVTMNQLSQDCEDSMKSTLTWGGDSGFGTGSNMEKLPSSQGSYLSQPTLSSKVLPLIPTTNTDSCERDMLLHTQFLQSVVGFQGLVTFERDSSVVTDTIFQLLSCFMAALSDPRMLPPAPLLRRAANVAAQTVESFHGPASGKLVEQAEGCLKYLTDLLLKHSQLGRFQVQETLADCLILLGGSSSLRLSFVHHTLCEINHFGDLLRKNESEGLQQFDVSRYENILYIFWILEQLLREKSVTGCNTQCCSLQSRPELSDELSRLEANMLQLSDEFPLFAIYSWRISVCMKATES